MRLMYIHGYDSTGQAVKAQLLQKMFPQHNVVAPTFDYNTLLPQQVFQQLRDLIDTEHPALILGSSTGGYYALCCTAFYDGPVWCVNPVRDILATIQKLTASTEALQHVAPQTIEQVLSAYRQFNQALFQQLHPRNGQLHFALSTDDELLGDHHPLLDRFPNHGSVVWKDHSGHRFYRFEELQNDIAQTL